MTTAIRIIVPVALLILGVAAFVAFGRRPSPESRDDAGKDRRPLVATEAATPYTEGLDIAADGIVVPFREITRAAEVSGAVVFKSPACNEGNFVKAGTDLIRIDPRDYELAERRLQAELKQAGVNLKELNVELENAEQRIPLAEREVKLREDQRIRLATLRAQGVASQEQLDESERGVITSRNALLDVQRQRDALKTRQLRMEAAIDVGQVELEQAQLNLQRATVKAPVSGVILRDDVEKDSYVQVGAPLFAIEDTSRVEVRCDLRMEEMRWIWRQRKTATATPDLGEPLRHQPLPPTGVTVEYELGGHIYSWRGKLDRYDGLGLDKQTRMIPCRIVVDKPHAVLVDGDADAGNGPRSLVRGMYVRLVIHTKPDVSLLRLPERVIQPGNIVWRVREGKLERVTLRIAQSIDEDVLVDAEASGLSAGDKLVVSPLQAAFTGLAVREETAREESPQ